jgi:class 3 adenylate cyclase
MTDVGRRVETLAIMMTDVEGSTALRMERGDVVADEILGTQLPGAAPCTPRSVR